MTTGIMQPQDVAFLISSYVLEVLEQIKSTHLAKYDSVVMDEMYIKDGLVFQKSTDALIGYEDLRDASNLLHDAQNQINHPNKVITTGGH